MTLRIDHIHIRSTTPRETAEWYAHAFDLRIVADRQRDYGDRLVQCRSADDTIGFSFSDARHGEDLAPASSGSRLGLEHFCFACSDLQAEIDRLVGLGARLLEGPFAPSPGIAFAFLEGPANVRIEILQRA